MDTLVLIGSIVAVIFVLDVGNRWWRDNKWRYHRHEDDRTDRPIR